MLFDIILSFLTAFTLTYFAIPSIIHIAKIKNLCDEPSERRAHTETTPSLGGIGIFAGMLFSIIMWTPFQVFGDLQYILCAFIIIFLIGAKDDIDPIAPSKKLLGELLAAIIVVSKSHVRITSFYGVFGLTDIPTLVSILLSIFIIIVIINAFNLIDGINGLSGSIGILISVTLGIWFYLIDNAALAILAFALSGAIVAFLKYNFTPAKIFMGDTGSLLLGLVNAILIIKFIELHRVIPTNNPYAFQAAPAVAIGIMILPLFDTFRVFLMRALKGKSPFHADRTHIHHLLLDSGLNHMQATGVLVLVNMSFIALSFALQNIGTMLLLTTILIMATFLTLFLHSFVANKSK